MAIHKPTVIYGLRPFGQLGYVRTLSVDLLQIVMPLPGGHDMSSAPPQVIELDRKDARLLAKRINHCLDDTRSK